MLKKILLSLCLISSTVHAQSSLIPDEFDPLEEMMHVNSAYIPNYQELMREYIYSFGTFRDNKKPDFRILIADGLELLTRSQWENDLDDLHRSELSGAKTDDEKFLLKLFSPENPIKANSPNRRFINSINGLFFKNRFCSQEKKPIDFEKITLLTKEYGLNIFSIEHCSSEKEKEFALNENLKLKIPAHIDTDIEKKYDTVGNIENVYQENIENIDTLNKVKNILIITNTRKFSDKDLFIEKIGKTNYDMIVIDPFFHFKNPFSNEDIQSLKSKRIGSRRLVFAHLNIAVAEDTRPYFEPVWKMGKPRWLRFQSKNNPAGIIVDYWNKEWKKIIGVYFRSIMDLGFDGVVLSGLSEHSTYERLIPIN